MRVVDHGRVRRSARIELPYDVKYTLPIVRRVVVEDERDDHRAVEDLYERSWPCHGTRSLHLGLIAVKDCL